MRKNPLYDNDREEVWEGQDIHTFRSITRAWLYILSTNRPWKCDIEEILKNDFNVSPRINSADITLAALSTIKKDYLKKHDISLDGLINALLAEKMNGTLNILKFRPLSSDNLDAKFGIESDDEDNIVLEDTHHLLPMSKEIDEDLDRRHIAFMKEFKKQYPKSKITYMCQRPMKVNLLIHQGKYDVCNYEPYSTGLSGKVIGVGEGGRNKLQKRVVNNGILINESKGIVHNFSHVSKEDAQNKIDVQCFYYKDPIIQKYFLSYLPERDRVISPEQEWRGKRQYSMVNRNKKSTQKITVETKPKGSSQKMVETEIVRTNLNCTNEYINKNNLKFMYIFNPDTHGMEKVAVLE